MAASDAASTLTPFILWLVLPGVATKLVLNFLYHYRILTLPLTAQQSELHTRRVRTLVIIGYLIYTIYQSLFLRPVNFYELLDVSTDSDTEVIRRSFRKLARIYHPDKMGGGLKNELLFIELRKAHDCLVEPVKRLAYDRFGYVVQHWTEAITLREYYVRGVQSSMAFYVVNPAMFGFMHWINGQRVINFWQFSLLALLLSLELSLILAPASPPWLRYLPSYTTPHNLVSALRTTYVAVNLASNQIYNLLPTPRGAIGTGEKDVKELQQDIQNIHTAMAALRDQWRDIRVESDRALAFDLLPLRPTPRASAQTVQQAASVAAGHAATKAREPSAAEETYIHLLSRLILRAKLSSFPAVKDTEDAGPASGSSAEGAARAEDDKRGEGQEERSEEAQTQQAKAPAQTVQDS